MPPKQAKKAVYKAKQSSQYESVQEKEYAYDVPSKSNNNSDFHNEYEVNPGPTKNQHFVPKDTT